MAIFTVLDVRAFSGLYPSCSQCFRRVDIAPVSKTTYSRRRRYECRLCGVVWEEGELEYRYCVTLTARQADGGDCKDVVVFGKSLDVVFGAPATHLQRFIQRYIMAGATPLMDPHSVFNLVAEPLRVTLLGKYFTAIIAQKKWSSTENPRYIGTKFNLLRRAHLPVTVLGYLQHQLFIRTPSPPLPLCLSGVKAGESCSPRANTQFSSMEKSSVLSPVPSAAGEQSLHVSLRSFTSLEGFHLSEEALGSSADNGNPKSLKDHQVLLSDFSELSNDTSAVGATGAVGGIGKTEDTVENSSADRYLYPSSSLEHLSNCGGFLQGSATDSAKGVVRTHETRSNNSEWCRDVGFSESRKCASGAVGTACCAEDDIVICDDVLSELMSTWREEEGHTVVQRRNSLQFYEDSESLPDSESFLKEFQCDFDQSPSFLTTNAAVSLLPSTPDSAAISPTLNRAHPGSCSNCDNAPLSLQQTPLGALAQYTPELFTSSVSIDLYQATSSTTSYHADEYTSVRNLSSSSPGGAAMSPELFSSPRPIVPPAVAGKLPLEADRRGTPAAGQDVKQPPKRRLLHPLHRFLQQASTPPSSVNDSLSHCFSPELFP